MPNLPQHLRNRFAMTILSTIAGCVLCATGTAQSCKSAKQKLETFLQRQPTACARDFDCDGYYLNADSCAPPIVLAKPGLSKNSDPELLKLQQRAREACASEWNQRPVCGPIPFHAACQKNRCVDASGFAPGSVEVAAQSRSAYQYSFIRHQCAPWDGPAIGVYLSKSKTDEQLNFPYLGLAVWRGLPPELNKPIALEGADGRGAANRCWKANACERAVSATITFTSFEPDHSASGSFELKFKNGEVERGTFKAAWREFHERCG